MKAIKIIFVPAAATTSRFPLFSSKIYYLFEQLRETYYYFKQCYKRSETQKTG